MGATRRPQRRPRSRSRRRHSSTPRHRCQTSARPSTTRSPPCTARRSPATPHLPPTSRGFSRRAGSSSATSRICPHPAPPCGSISAAARRCSYAQADAGIGGFVNACRHRGSRLVDGDATTGLAYCIDGRIRCPAHGWIYESTGALAHVPRESIYPALDRGALALERLAVSRVGGWVFVALASDPQLPLAAGGEWLAKCEPATPAAVATTRGAARAERRVQLARRLRRRPRPPAARQPGGGRPHRTRVVACDLVAEDGVSTTAQLPSVATAWSAGGYLRQLATLPPGSSAPLGVRVRVAQYLVRGDRRPVDGHAGAAGVPGANPAARGQLRRAGHVASHAGGALPAPPAATQPRRRARSKRLARLQAGLDERRRRIGPHGERRDRARLVHASAAG